MQKNFRAPLKALNLQQYPTQPYDACPFCLSKIGEAPIEAAIKGSNEQLTRRRKTIKQTSKNQPAASSTWVT